MSVNILVSYKMHHCNITGTDDLFLVSGDVGTAGSAVPWEAETSSEQVPEGTWRRRSQAPPARSPASVVPADALALPDPAPCLVGRLVGRCRRPGSWQTLCTAHGATPAVSHSSCCSRSRIGYFLSSFFFSEFLPSSPRSDSSSAD